MTGAGSATVAFVKETDFNTLPGTPTYYQPGRNLTVEDVEIVNALQRMQNPDSAESQESLAGPFEGAFSASWLLSSDTHADVRDIVFNDAGTGFVDGAAATSAWYLGVDYINGTAERALGGVTPLQYSLSYNVDQNAIQASLTAGYATEDYNTSITPGSITKPSEGSTIAKHGITYTLDSVGKTEKLQSLSLEFSNISRLQRGPAREPVDAVIARPESVLRTDAIYEGPDTIELAYGASAATTIQDSVGGVTASVEFDDGGTTLATYTLSNVTPDTYNWQDLVAENDLTEPVTYHVNGVSIA